MNSISSAAFPGAALYRPPVDLQQPATQDSGGAPAIIGDCCPMPRDWAPRLPDPFPPRWPFGKDDTVEYRNGCFGPPSITLDTGAHGPDMVKVHIHEDGSSTVTINGKAHEYSADETQRLNVRVDENDNVQIQDDRSMLNRILNPRPIDVYQSPR